MRIIQRDPGILWSPLEAFKAGTPVLFASPFHDKHDEKDIFLINAVCTSYRPEQRKYERKICVSNLRTGDIAYVDKDRRCVVAKVVVTQEENCAC